MRGLFKVLAISLALSGSALAEPFKEMTVGIPVTSIGEAETWYVKFLGADTEIIKPFPGVIELKAAPNVWLQLYEAEGEATSGAVIRFLVEDMAQAQAARAEVGINTGEAIVVPDVVTYSEFVDPFGNALGFYALP